MNATPVLRLMLLLVAIGWPVDARAAPAIRAGAPLFAFRSGFWINLHQFLYVLGRARNGEPDSHRAAVAQAPGDLQGLDARSGTEREAWDAAVAFYAAGLSKRDAIFDDDLVSITKTLGDATDASDLRGLSLDPALVATLTKVAPVYRAVWWPRHSRANAIRRDDLQARLDTFGLVLVKRLTTLYQTDWPARPRVVDLCAYAHWAGAYSTSAHGGLIVFASTDEGISGALGLETLLHESSHQWDDEIAQRLRAIAAKQGLAVPPVLSHTLIFYTSGEIVAEAIPGHVPYAIKFGLWDRGSFQGMKPLLDEYWRPYLKGHGTFDQAIAAILAHAPR